MHLELVLQLAAIEGEAAEVVAVERVGEIEGAAVLAVEAALDEHVLEAVAHVFGDLAQVLVEGADAPEEGLPAEPEELSEHEPLEQGRVLVRQGVHVLQGERLDVADCDRRELHGHAVLDLAELHHLELQVFPHEQRQLQRGRREAYDDHERPDDLPLVVARGDNLGEPVGVALGAELGDDLDGAASSRAVAASYVPTAVLVVVLVVKVPVQVLRRVAHHAVLVVVVVVVPVFNHGVVARVTHLVRRAAGLVFNVTAATHGTR